MTIKQPAVSECVDLYSALSLRTPNALTMPYKDNGNNPFSAARLKIIDKKNKKCCPKCEAWRESKS